MARVCPNCGSMIYNNSTFCRECGISLISEDKRMVKTCSKCNNPIAPDHMYCSRCGVNLNNGRTRSLVPILTFFVFLAIAILVYCRFFVPYDSGLNSQLANISSGGTN